MVQNTSFYCVVPLLFVSLLSSLLLHSKPSIMSFLYTEKDNGMMSNDPDDRSLRQVEKTVVIPKMVKAEANLRCADEVAAFTECAKSSGLLLVFKCREVNKAMQECIASHCQQADVDEQTEIFLEQRRQHRLKMQQQKQREEQAAQEQT
eukprot:m.43879 g.43879  ORF g.43879 m.43879 type:complete len:149 (+) comp10802_c0_seq1:301-747(+)